MGFNSGFKGLNRQPFSPLQRHSNSMRTAASVWPDCRLETNPLCWSQTVGGDNIPVVTVSAANINSNVFGFYFLIWSLSWLLCCRFWLQCSRSLYSIADTYKGLVECYWQWRATGHPEETLLVVLCPPQIPNEPTWDRTRASASDCLRHNTGPSPSFVV
jgi:hypothetical protein